MKTLIASLVGAGAMTVLAAPALAQQVPPVTDPKAAVACEPADLAAAVACLDRFLKPEVKAEITKVATPSALEPSEVYVGLWIRNNWGLWSGSPLFQYMMTRRVVTPEAQGERIVQAYWLKSRGCSYDFNNVGFVVAGMQKAGSGADPCAVSLAEANTAARTPMGAATPGAAPAGRGGRAGAAAAAAGDADEGAED